MPQPSFNLKFLTKIENNLNNLDSVYFYSIWIIVGLNFVFIFYKNLKMIAMKTLSGKIRFDFITKILPEKY